MSDLDELIEFFLARIAEDEAAARLADGVTDKQEDDWQDVTQPLTLADTLKHESWAKKYGYAYEHIARHDPARVLRECEAKRRIVETAQDIDMIENEWGQSILRDLASVYSDHPDYREEWKP